jgi:hypothetical protein
MNNLRHPVAFLYRRRQPTGTQNEIEDKTLDLSVGQGGTKSYLARKSMQVGFCLLFLERGPGLASFHSNLIQQDTVDLLISNS